MPEQYENWDDYGREVLRRHALLDSDEERIALVPTQAMRVHNEIDGPQPEEYRQALRVMLTNPDIERNLNYITATMLATVFGGWLAGKLIRTRAFALFIDVLLLFVCLALVGLFIGIMLGNNLLPFDTVPFLLLLGLVMVLFILGLVIWSLVSLASPPAESKPRQTIEYTRERVVTRRRR